MIEDNNDLRRSSNFLAGFNGIYTCVINGSDSIQTLFIGIYENYPSLTAFLSVNTLPEPSRLLLNCSSSGLPATTVRWFFGDQLITIGEQVQFVANRRETVYHSLLSITRHELISGELIRNGQYRCEVNSEEDTAASVNASADITKLGFFENLNYAPSPIANVLYNRYFCD